MPKTKKDAITKMLLLARELGFPSTSLISDRTRGWAIRFANGERLANIAKENNISRQRIHQGILRYLSMFDTETKTYKVRKRGRNKVRIETEKRMDWTHEAVVAATKQIIYRMGRVPSVDEYIKYIKENDGWPPLSVISRNGGFKQITGEIILNYMREEWLSTAMKEK